MMAGTVDEDIMAALEQRRDVVTAVVDGLRAAKPRRRHAQAVAP